MGTRVAQLIWAGSGLQPACLADPEGNPKEPIFDHQTPKCGTQYVYVMKIGHSRMEVRKLGPIRNKICRQRIRMQMSGTASHFPQECVNRRQLTAELGTSKHRICIYFCIVYPPTFGEHRSPFCSCTAGLSLFGKHAQDNFGFTHVVTTVGAASGVDRALSEAWGHTETALATGLPASWMH